MSIGTIIKKLRLERDWTQEQLAEYLGISSRSISQWECGRTAPDISQLPVLCNIFEVSADILLGIDVENKEKRIKEVLQKAKQQWALGYNVEATEILREALKEFPNSYEVMNDLMSCIWRVRNELENSNGFDELTKEVILLGEKILSKCTNQEIRINAVQLLCYTYAKIGELDKAVSLANQVPTITRDLLLCDIYQGTKRYEKQQEVLLQYLSDFPNRMLFNNALLDDSTRPYTNEECIEIHKKYLAIMELFFEDRNYGFFRQSIAWTHIYLAVYYMYTKNTAEAIKCLQIAKKHSILSDTEYNSESRYTCLLFRGQLFGEMWHNVAENDCLHQLEEMKNPVFDPLRTTTEFKMIEEELKKYAEFHK